MTVEIGKPGTVGRERDAGVKDTRREGKGDEFGGGTSQVKVTDRRRIGMDGEPLQEEDVVATLDETSADNSETGLIDNLREAETTRAEAERQVQEYADRFRQAQAQIRVENDELRARLQRNFDQKLETARGDIVGGLLDTLDNLKRAVRVAETSDKREQDFDGLLDGIRATMELFETRLKALGLTAIESASGEFNPEFHEAVEIVPVAAEEDNQIVAELQPGYRFGERLLRPARVRVGRATDG